MIRDMKLAGLVEGIQHQYLRAVRQLTRLLHDFTRSPQLAPREDELILDRIHAELGITRAKLPADVRAAQSEELRRRCQEATRYRLEQEAGGDDQGELPDETTPRPRP
jgi:hypothetical protein